MLKKAFAILMLLLLPAAVIHAAQPAPPPAAKTPAVQQPAQPSVRTPTPPVVRVQEPRASRRTTINHRRTERRINCTADSQLERTRDLQRQQDARRNNN